MNIELISIAEAKLMLKRDDFEREIESGQGYMIFSKTTSNNTQTFLIITDGSDQAAMVRGQLR